MADSRESHSSNHENGSFNFERCFQKVVLKPPGEVGKGIRIVYHNDNNQQHHHPDDPDNKKKKIIGDVVANDGDDGRIQSLPYKKNGPYTCSRCIAVFETSQKFAAHTGSHYKYESKAEKMKRQMAKMMRRSRKRALLELQKQQIKDFGGGESTLQVNVEDQAHHNNNINNYDVPPSSDVRFSVGKIKTEFLP